MGLFDKFKSQPAESASNPVPATNGKKVLIVEDEKILGDALQVKFEHQGYTVLRAFNGQEGLDICNQNRPDVILLDLMMPVMDGKTMLRLLREKPEFKTLPVLVLTNAGDLDNIRETQMYYGATDFFIKSNVNTEEVITRVQNLLF